MDQRAEDKTLRFGTAILHGLRFAITLNLIFHDCLHVGKVVQGDAATTTSGAYKDDQRKERSGSEKENPEGFCEEFTSVFRKTTISYPKSICKRDTSQR